MGLQKRKEHNLETWALFIGLVKAFDSVPREALFAVLRRFGLPDHFVNIVIRLHENARIEVKVGSVDSELESYRCATRLLRGPSAFLVHHAGGDGDDELASAQARVSHA
jgi:hypothetical protein